MKLATYKDGSRDGQLIVVSRDLSLAHYATGSAATLQQALDDWNFIAPQLQDLYVALNQGRARHAFPFDVRQCMAPLPRAFQRIGSRAYAANVALLEPLQQADGPHLYQASGDHLLGPTDDWVVTQEADEIDVEAGLAVLTGDVPMGATPAQALDGVRLITLASELCLRRLEQSQDGAILGRPAASFGPVACTLDELGDAWQQGRLALTLQTACNGRKLGLCDAGEMTYHFGQLIAQLCKTRPVCAGTLIGSGPVSNAGTDADGQRQWPRGSHSVAEKRAIELAEGAIAPSAYLRYGDTVRSEMKGRDGNSLFGAMEQVIAPPPG